MLNLKKIILNLSDKDYSLIEENLIKNDADNFLYLLNTYRKSEDKDREIVHKMNISSNSFYVLKSRLMDKIQDYLSGDIFSNREEVIRLLHKVPEVCYNGSRDIASAFLLKLEKDLQFYDMHSELLVVYSALKRIHLFSDKYFHYSQLYNKHIAYSMSLEKSIELLGHFNRTLAQYDFSRSQKTLETLLFLRGEINNHFSLNKSRQILVIKNIIELQLIVFCNTNLDREETPDELLNNTRKAINEMPASFTGKNWLTILDYLSFEYFRITGQSKSAANYFEKVNNNFKVIVLYTDVCLSSRFLISRITYLQETDATNLLKSSSQEDLLFDPNDTHTLVLLRIYDAMVAYYQGNLKEATNQLNGILNTTSFKDFFHINAEVKLSLIFLYIKQNEFTLAESLLKNLYRKAKSDSSLNYRNVTDLIKVFNAEVKTVGNSISTKQRDDYTLFKARNTNEIKMLEHLMHEFNKRYEE